MRCSCAFCCFLPVLSNIVFIWSLCAPLPSNGLAWQQTPSTPTLLPHYLNPGPAPFPCDPTATPNSTIWYSVAAVISAGKRERSQLHPLLAAGAESHRCVAAGSPLP